MESDVLAFLGVALALTLVPGADWTLVTRRALTSSTGEACVTAAGVCTGVLAWGALSALGIAALVAASATAYDALRFAGAIYLAALGAHALLTAGRLARQGGPLGVPSAPMRRSTRSAFAQGLANNMLNPKIAVFYATLLPQFVSPQDSVLLVSILFAACHAAMGMAYLSASAWAAGRARGAFQRPRVRAALEAVAGTVLLGLGLRLALERR